MKRNFELVEADGTKTKSVISIVGDKKHPDEAYVSIEADYVGIPILFIPENELERFAVNILKAIGSNKLASNRGTGQTYII